MKIGTSGATDYMYRVYGMSASGNCHKVRLVLEHLRVPYDWHEVDITTGITRQPEFLSKNPNGRVPLLEVEPGKYLPESNAILFFLAEGTTLLPATALGRAEALSWMFFEQYSHEPYVAVARYVCKFLPTDHPRRAELPNLHSRGNAALKVMEQALQGKNFLLGDKYSIADIALYAYTHCADEGGFDLRPYKAIGGWLRRVESQPRFTPMSR